MCISALPNTLSPLNKMILQSLSNLHERLSSIPDNGLAPQHYSAQEITIKIVLLPDRSFEILDFRQQETKARHGKEVSFLAPRLLIVPGEARATEASFEPCFLWDDTRFVLGWHGQKNDTVRNKKCRDAFVTQHLKHEEDINDPDYSLFCDFLRNWETKNIVNHPDLLKIKKGRIVFEVAGKNRLLHETPRVREWFLSMARKPDSRTKTGQCLITGQLDRSLARLHPGIRNFPGSPYTGASIVSFNDSAYESYGKEGKNEGRGINSPCSEAAVKSYAAALDWLLSKNQSQRTFKIADSQAVFWTSEKTEAEENFPWMLAGPPNPENYETLKRLNNLLSKIHRGTSGDDLLGNPQAEFYILGLSLNQGRLSVRFWQTGSLGELIGNLKLHFNHLEIIREWDEHSKHPDSKTPNAKDLLLQIVPLKEGRRDEGKIPSQLAGALMRSILTGTRYPDSLAQGVMNRIRIIEKKPKGDGNLENVTYLRAAILKAWLLRNHNEWLNQQNITMTTALDKDNPSVAYQLGRLFAIYEQAQRAAHEYKLERTIRETMFSSASSTPLAIFVSLDKLNKHHLQKLKKGSKNYLSDLIDEIHQKITASGSYPASLDLKKQSLFCIGYYHQRHDLRQRKQTPAKTI